MEITRNILICNENSEERKKIIEALIRSGYRHIDEATSGDAAIPYGFHACPGIATPVRTPVRDDIG